MAEKSAQSRGPGAPSKFTPEVQARLIAALRDGNHIETACALAGISDETFRKWRRAGESGDPQFVGFVGEVTRAMAEAETALLSTVKTHSADDWRAASWILERRHPDRWANTQRVRLEVEKELRSVLDALESKMSPEAYRELIDALASIGEDSEGKETGMG